MVRLCHSFKGLTAAFRQKLRQLASHLSGAQIREGGGAKKPIEEGTTMEIGCDS